MGEMQKSGDKGNKLFQVEATHISANGFFITFISFFITLFLWWNIGWHQVTKFILYLSLFLFVLSCLLPYFKFMKRNVSVLNDALIVGKRTISIEEIQKISCEGLGREFHIHIASLKEPLTIYIEEKDRKSTREFIQAWCKERHLSFEHINR